MYEQKQAFKCMKKTRIQMYEKKQEIQLLAQLINNEIIHQKLSIEDLQPFDYFERTRGQCFQRSVK